MHVISEKALRAFWTKYTQAASPLRVWLKLIKHGRFRNFAGLKRTFPTADLVRLNGRDFYVFDIKGNSCRLVASIHFNTQKLFVRRVMTHPEYDRGDWKKNP